MPPKKKGGKKQVDDSDAFWESKAKSSPLDTPVAGSDDDDFSPTAPAPKKGKGGKKAGGGGGFASFADMMVDDGEDDDDQASEPEEKPAPAPKQDSDGEDGGLMAMAKKAKGKKDKKKAKKHVVDDDDYDFGPEPSAPSAPAEEEEDLAAPRGAQDAGDDWMEEEFGASAKKAKGKKGKGAGKKQQKKLEDDEFEAALAGAVGKVSLEEEKEAEPAAKAAAAPPKEEKEEKGEEEDGEPTRLLSKKEKEKLKKEKEKAKKKAQAAAKKASEPTPAAAAPSPAAESPAADAPPADDAAEEEGGDASASAKNKKKKKKKGGAAAAADEAAPEPAPTGKKGKGGGGQLAALRALMEAQKKAQEEAERAAEEERLRVEEEERRAAEEEKRKEEARLAKKEKEKAKKEQLKREGKLLTPKQKAERAAAEARRAALLASGNVAVAGLAEKAAGGDGPAKKASYGNRKKGGKPSAAAPATPAAAEPEPAKEEEVKPAAPAAAAAAEEDDEDVKDSWDASSSEDEAKGKEEEEVVKDSWDASSSDEEDEEKPAAKPAAKANGKPTAKQPPAPQASVPAKGKPAPAAKGKGKAATPESSSEEESSDSGSDSDSESDSDDDSEDDSSDDDGMTAAQRQEAARKAEAKERRLAKNAEALAARSRENLRSPICVIMGHVDTGKTKLLDKIRQTNVQEGEAGGITQQIGATYFPMEAIQAKTSVLGANDLKEYKLPGLLVIDTPGHESFTNLRTRGSSLCNIAILVVDIMHGLEPQTLESLRLLREGKTPFIVALNKIDRIYGWKAIKDNGFLDSLKAQDRGAQNEYEKRLNDTIVAFAEQGLNAVPYYKNTNFAKNVSLVPTSAHTGEGVPDMLMLIIKLTQERMAERLMYISTLECTVLEVKVIEGLGTTIDVVLSNGVLYEGDTIVVCGLNGPIVTQVRALLTPQPMKELRIKGQYVHHKSIKAAMGVKIVAPDLEKAIAGSRLLVVGEDDDVDELREEVMSDLTNLLDSVDKSGRGVCVQASTLGSLEALLEFLRVSKIPVSGINIGPVHKKDVMRCATMLEKAKELAVILCFDVAVDKDAEKLATELGIKIFTADIIYHLFDQFTAYHAQMVEEKKAESADKAVFPVRLRTIACFAKRDPIILGCDIIDGSLRIGTPVCVVKVNPETKKKEVIKLGQITSLEVNHKTKQIVKKHEAGAGVAVKIERAPHEQAQQYGRHFDDKDEVISLISRESIDVLKQHFRDEVFLY
ncbi:eukaryotic translation initiation factor 5B [Rhodosporidiobolus nylandii]